MKYISYLCFVLTSLILLISCGGSSNNNLSSEKAITDFWINGTHGIINESQKTITVRLPYHSYTEASKLMAYFTTTGVKVSIGSDIKESGYGYTDFTNPVIYTVTAENGSSVRYTVTVRIGSDAKSILYFSIEGTVGAINESNKTITVNMPLGSNVTALIATFVTTGLKVSVDSIIQNSGSTQHDFTNPVIYTVTAEDKTSVQYTVTVVTGLSSAKSITAFSLIGIEGIINETDKTIAVPITSDTDVSMLFATFTTTGARVNIINKQQISGVTPNNFTYPVFYTVIAEDGTSVNYQVTTLSQSLSYQINYAHSGRANMAGPISFPAKEAWSVTFDGPISYPLIAGGKVFVLMPVPDEFYSGVDLYALDIATGGIIWGPVNVYSGSASWAGFAYDRGKIFVMSYDALLTSYDANTGRIDWTKDLKYDWGDYNVYNSNYMPVAVNGIIYVTGGGGGTLFAVDELNGDVLWMQLFSEPGSLTVSYNGVFVGSGVIYKIDPLLGYLIYWNGRGGIHLTPAYANGLLYIRDWVKFEFAKKGLLTYNAETGEEVDALSVSMVPHISIPAINSQTKFVVIDGILRAMDLDSSNTIWSFSGDGMLVTAPIIINEYVLVGSGSGLVYALNSSDGTQIWSANAGAPIEDLWLNEYWPATPLQGFGAGEGHLIVLPAMCLQLGE